MLNTVVTPSETTRPESPIVRRPGAQRDDHHVQIALGPDTVSPPGNLAVSKEIGETPIHSIDVQLRTSEHRSMYSYVRLSIDRCTATYV